MTPRLLLLTVTQRYIRFKNFIRNERTSFRAGFFMIHSVKSDFITKKLGFSTSKIMMHFAFVIFDIALMIYL
jgi:hypothetical protein